VLRRPVESALGAVVGVKDDPGCEVAAAAAGRDRGQERIEAQLRAQVIGERPAQQPP
jgi:hypothetical protein